MPACGIRQRFPGRRRSSLGGLVQKQRRLHPLLGVLLCRALHSPQNGKHVSRRRAERNGKPSLCLSTASSFLRRFTLPQQSQQGQRCPPQLKGIPDASISFHLEGQQVSCCTASTQPLCCGCAAVQKQDFQAIGVAFGPQQFPDLAPLCSNTILH